jgi:hypothetical protein
MLTCEKSIPGVTLAGFEELQRLLPDPGDLIGSHVGDGAVRHVPVSCNHFCEGGFIVGLDLLYDSAGLR